MALDRSDLWARLQGFLFFLPILIPVLAGYPYILIGTGFALSAIYEAVHGWQGGSLSAVLAMLMMGDFYCPSCLKAMPLPQLAIMAGTGGIWAAGKIYCCRPQRFIASHIFCLARRAFVLISFGDYYFGRYRAYFSGGLYGPKLALPLAHQNMGGLLRYFVCLIVFCFWQMHLSAVWRAGCGLAILSQIGDLYESAMKSFGH